MDKLFSLHMDKLQTTLRMLPNEQVGEVIRALVKYQETGENKENPKDRIVEYAFVNLKQSLVSLNEKRAFFLKSQREKANKRWRNSGKK